VDFQHSDASEPGDQPGCAAGRSWRCYSAFSNHHKEYNPHRYSEQGTSAETYPADFQKFRDAMASNRLQGKCRESSERLVVSTRALSGADCRESFTA